MSSNIFVKLLGCSWLLGTISLLIIVVFSFVPKDMVPPDFEGFNLLDVTLAVIFFMVGYGILKYQRWAWLSALIISLLFLVHFIWIAIEFKQYIFLDLACCIYQFVLLAKVKRDFAI